MINANKQKIKRTERLNLLYVLIRTQNQTPTYAVSRHGLLKITVIFVVKDYANGTQGVTPECFSKGVLLLHQKYVSILIKRSMKCSA